MTLETSSRWLVAAGAVVAMAVIGPVAGWTVAGPRALELTAGAMASAALVVALVLLLMVRSLTAHAGLRSVTVIVWALTAGSLVHLSFLIATSDSSIAMAWAAAAEVAVLTTALGVLAHRSTHAARAGVTVAVLGLAAVALLVIAVAFLDRQPQVLAARTALAAVVWSAHVVATAVVVRDWPWGRTTRAAMALALLAIGVGRTAGAAGLEPQWSGAVLAEMEVFSTCLLAGILFLVVRWDLLVHRRRSRAMRQQLLEERERERRRRIDRHAIGNRVAGISMASELLDDDGLDRELRRRLERTIQSEAEQLRLLLDPPSPVRATAVITDTRVGESHVNQSR